MFAHLTHRRPRLTALATLMLTAALGACGDKNAAQNSAPKGQVVAKVGDTDVTIHELQNEYRHLRLTQNRINDDVTRQVLTEIVKRKALVQRAQAGKLDREPTVLLDLLRAREQVLATTILQRDLQAKVSTIGKTETDRYINANPARFSQRIRYDIDRLMLATQFATPEFMEKVKNASSIDEIERAVTGDKLQYSRGTGILYNGDLPAELLNRLKARKDSDIFAVVNGASTMFFKVSGERLDPLAGEEATKLAGELIRREMTMEELQRKAEVTGVVVKYFGDYEKIMAGKPAEPAKK